MLFPETKVVSQGFHSLWQARWRFSCPCISCFYSYFVEMILSWGIFQTRPSRSWNFFSILPRSVPLGLYIVSSEDSIRADAGCSLRDSAVGFLYSLSFWDNSVALPRYCAQCSHPIDFWLICQVEFSFVLIEAFSPCSLGARRYWIPLLFDCLHFFLIVLFIRIVR